MRNILISAGFFLLPLAAAAQSQVDASDANVLANLLKAEGYQLDITTDKVGDPLLKGKLDGTNYDIFFYDCTNNANCRTIQFQVGYDMTNGMSLQRANQWNSDMRYATVHLDNEMDPFLQMDLNIDYGVSAENFVDNFKMWSNVLGQFEDFIDWD
ncbi:YbjN domain-containing protein [uncultured Pelagimonas sp.]|uniref:YbjN domain-containing protein n=1 Tax=uncultured Pelagimonas sp. TaxID=1618102 RepID=UPI002618EAE2|nr:YbjN domain-containing protein [uncultured Pelagimonas sp.]